MGSRSRDHRRQPLLLFQFAWPTPALTMRSILTTFGASRFGSRPQRRRRRAWRGPDDRGSSRTRRARGAIDRRAPPLPAPLRRTPESRRPVPWGRPPPGVPGALSIAVDRSAAPPPDAVPPTGPRTSTSPNEESRDL